MKGIQNIVQEKLVNLVLLGSQTKPIKDLQLKEKLW